MINEVFPSTRNWISKLAVWGTIVVIAVALSFEAQASGPTAVKITLFIFSLLIVGLLLWIWFGTHYRISGNTLHYRSGPLRGSIPINSIRKIQLNKYLWVGLRPALGTAGLILYYNKWDEIYFSPTEKERFVQLLIQVNPKIVVE
ncbi:PH domain-containing protein [Rufibacter roseus]|uniref:PH domain-containing protein n=1 Tax=Rufibacter roseus TaxID=1567108 RepID=A0ABW2DFS1_9BACT|nr:PH domain-containing protein [Rufibacter roseus]